MGKSKRKHRSVSRSPSSASSSSSHGRRDHKDKKRHRHREDRDHERKRSRRRHGDEDRGREKDRERSRDRDRDRDRDKDRDRKSSRRHRGDGESSRRSKGSEDKGKDAVAKIAAMISEKALGGSKPLDEVSLKQKEKEEEERQKRRERLKAWREAKSTTATPSSKDDPTDLPDAPAPKTVESSGDSHNLQAGHMAPMSLINSSIRKSHPNSINASASKIAMFDSSDEPEQESSGGLSKTIATLDSQPEDLQEQEGEPRTQEDQNSSQEKENESGSEFDPLDAFMSSLYGTGDVTEQFEDSSRASKLRTSKINPNGTNFITLEQITGSKANTSAGSDGPSKMESDTDSVSGKVYDPSDWKSDISFSPAPVADEEREEKERRDFLEALREAHTTKLLPTPAPHPEGVTEHSGPDTAASEKEKSADDHLGRVFAGEGDMIDESEVEAKKKSALDILEEQKRGKELKPIDHSKIEYEPFRKNLYIVPRTLAGLSAEELRMRRDLLQMKVRGKGCPAPVDSWDQCGLSERMLSVINKYNFEHPFAIQKQALPAIMCGRDIIAVAKTGSGKTLAFLLPMFRHILDQPPLRDAEGPIGIIMAPARELAFQIYNEAKKFTKALGLRVACIYGGAGVADQIADLKRGADIVVCTPGRMIDILCMQAGKLVSLRRVTMVVMDEADRMFDMGFEPQIKMIIQNIRPDRQTVLFSATFPKQIEKLAKSILKYPLEIVIGERSTANKDITQYVEVHEKDDKYMRLLQLLGIWYERGSVLIFVDKQEACDQLFQDLLKSGYPCVSLHGGKDQLDRDHTLHEFKSGIKTVMVATSVAGRGLDVPDIVCVINYHCPNHMEDYVHRVGRTGRAGRKGTAYTFITPNEEQHAPTMVSVLEKAGVTSEDIPAELVQLSDAFKEKVKRGEAKWSSNGFSGSKGFSFDSSEMNESQKLASMQRRAYEIEQGIISEKGDEVEVYDDYYDEDEDEAFSQQEGASSLEVPEGGEAPADSTQAALEKARALAVSMGIGSTSSSATSAPALTSDGKVDTKAALQRAKMIAMQMSGASDDKAGSHFMDELDINDYPAQVRKKVTHRNILDEVTENTGTNIISRGSYIAPGKKPEVGERRLYLLIEGPTEMQVKQAKLEIARQLEEETLRQGAGQLGFGGRYNVI